MTVAVIKIGSTWKVGIVMRSRSPLLLQLREWNPYFTRTSGGRSMQPICLSALLWQLWQNNQNFDHKLQHSRKYPVLPAASLQTWLSWLFLFAAAFSLEAASFSCWSRNRPSDSRSHSRCSIFASTSSFSLLGTDAAWLSILAASFSLATASSSCSSRNCSFKK